MDQKLYIEEADRRRAIESLSLHVADSVASARGEAAPFHHLIFDRVFPAATYNAMLTAMPVAADYRPMSGRAKGNDAADGTHTRVKIDLFPEYIRALPPEKRSVWDVVGRALCSEPVKDALIHRLTPGLMRRFGAGFCEALALSAADPDPRHSGLPHLSAPGYALEGHYRPVVFAARRFGRPCRDHFS